VAPILISGAGGTLGKAFATICRRATSHRLLDRTAWTSRTQGRCRGDRALAVVGHRQCEGLLAH
jgi:hypothetical protein